MTGAPTTSKAIEERHPSWSVPAFEESVFRNKTHRYALVIPVINEGERIRSQLRRLSLSAQPIDIVIADGGSTDGSVDDDFLSGVGVAARLTKTDTGKLSAQLRMAYAWCLDRGYDGIVTMDGNDKDGVDAVATFIQKLEAGYDYIQGSRYLEHGVAENTPLDREIGNRVIQAPLLSFLGLRHYTDTTNGFRAYSRRFLLDPAVAPFRDVFATYQLLSYLTVRAGQRNYRTCEVPVARRYPKDAPTPTKITGWAARWSLLKETLQAAAGRFHPMEPERKSIRPSFNEVLFAFLVVVPLFLIGASYSFPYSNHGQELPPILRLVDPALFVGDFAVESFLHPGPRWYYNHLVAALITAGISPPAVYLTLYVAALGSTVLALLMIGRQIFGEDQKGLSVLGVLLVAFALLPKSGWDSAVFSTSAIPSAFAMGIVTWGIAAATCQRWVLAYGFFGLGALLQFLVGFLPGLLLALPLLITTLGKRRYRTLFGAIGLWGIGLAAVYIPMAIDQPGETRLIKDMLDPMWLFGFIRVPHHWLPSFAPVWHWPNVAFFYLAGLILAFGPFRDTEVRLWAPAIASIAAVGAAALLANFLFVEVWFVDLIGKLQFQRAMPFVRLAILVVICGSIAALWRRNRKMLAVGIALASLFEFNGFALLALCLLDRASFRQELPSQPRNRDGIWVSIILVVTATASFVLEPQLMINRLTIAAVLGLALMFACSRILEDLTPLKRQLPVLSMGALSILLALILHGQSVATAAAGLRVGVNWGYESHAQTGPERLAIAARRLSSPEQKFILPPSMRFDTFSYHSRRPVFFNWKNVPYTESGLVQWGERLISLIGKIPEKGDGWIEFERYFANVSSDTLRELAERHEIDFIVSHQRWHKIPNAKVVHTVDGWVLWELEPDKAR